MCSLSIVQAVTYRRRTVVIDIWLLKDRVDEKFFAKVRLFWMLRLVTYVQEVAVPLKKRSKTRCWLGFNDFKRHCFLETSVELWLWAKGIVTALKKVWSVWTVKLCVLLLRSMVLVTHTAGWWIVKTFQGNLKSYTCTFNVEAVSSETLFLSTKLHGVTSHWTVTFMLNTKVT
jgi:hypothetical protein